MDSPFQSCALRQSKLHLCQDRGSREEAELYLTRGLATHRIQRSEEGQNKETGAVQGFGNEGMALRTLVRLLCGEGWSVHRPLRDELLTIHYAVREQGFPGPC